MKISVKGLAVAGAVTWGSCVFFLSVINCIRPGYGAAFLAMISSVYPGYHAGQGISSVIIGTLDALVDGGIAGALLAWAYNWATSLLQSPLGPK